MNGAVVAVLGAWVIALVRLVGLVWDNAVDLPFQDQWAVLTPVFERASLWDAFTWQHGPPRQGLGGLIQWVVYPAAGWDVRAESWCTLIALVIAAATATLLAVHLRGRIAWWDIALPLLLLGAMHWETILLTPNISHSILPLALTFALATGWAGKGGWGSVALVSGAGFLAQFTGFGFSAAAVSAGLAVVSLRRGAGWGRAKVLVVVAAYVATVALFMVGYVWAPAVPGWRFPVANWWDYLRFVGLMFSSLLGFRSLGWPSALAGSIVGAGVVFIFARATWRLWRLRGEPRDRVVCVLAGTSLAFAAFTAMGRLPAGIEAAFMWRYLPLLVTGVCAFVYALDDPWVKSREWARRSLPICVMLIAAKSWWNFRPEVYAAKVAQGKRLWIEAYLRTRDLSAANHESDFYVLSADPESAVVKSRLDWLAARGGSFFPDGEQSDAAPGGR